MEAGKNPRIPKKQKTAKKQRTIKRVRRTTSPSLRALLRSRRKTSTVPVLWQADYHASPLWQFVFRYCRGKRQVDPQLVGCHTCRFIEKVNDIPAKSILHSSPFIQIEGACRIHLDIGTLAQHRSQLAVPAQRALAYLSHRERDNSIRHNCRRGGRRRPSSTDEA